jgi:signal transduction histidine kinase
MERINEMEDGHNYLAHDSVSIVSHYHSPEIDAIYFKAPVFLDRKMGRFLEEARLLEKANGDELRIDNPHLQYLLSSSNDLLASSNLIVYQYQKENENKIDRFHFQKALMSIGVLLSYLLVGIFLFRPMTKKIDKSLTEIEDKELELQKINEAHIASIIDAQETERQRIATDLHDGLIQTLTAAAYKVETAIHDKNFYAVKSLIDDAISETHNIAHNILPPLLKEFGLVPALKSLSEEVKTQSGINITFQSYEFTGRLKNKLELALYRITQESLSNIQKHAEAKNVKVQLIQHPDTLVLIIEDDGKGFDVSKTRTGKGMGLMNIQERVKAFNGNVTINSSSEMGTEIIVEIPTLIHTGEDA